jgi:hypothetical protein
VDSDEILCGGGDIDGDLDSILFNAAAATIPKWRTFKLLRWVQLLNRLVDLDEILHGADGIEYCLPYVYVGKVGILVLPRTSCLICCLRIVEEFTQVLRRWNGSPTQ